MLCLASLYQVNCGVSINGKTLLDKRSENSETFCPGLETRLRWWHSRSSPGQEANRIADSIIKSLTVLRNLHGISTAIEFVISQFGGGSIPVQKFVWNPSWWGQRFYSVFAKMLEPGELMAFRILDWGLPCPTSLHPKRQ